MVQPCNCDACDSLRAEFNQALEAAQRLFQSQLLNQAQTEGQAMTQGQAITEEKSQGLTLKDIDALEREGWEDISGEQYREYAYPDGHCQAVQAPLLLHISQSGGNRIVDQFGICHYIMPGWTKLSYLVHPGQPFFWL